MRYLILALLLPSLLSGADFAVKTTGPVKQPANTIDRVSLRKKNVVVFEKDSIGSGILETRYYPGPIHWDSAGTWKRYDFTERATFVAGYDKVVNAGPFRIEYLSTTGKMRYTESGMSLEFTPDSATATVKTDLIINSKGVKTNLFLTKSSPNRLAWGLISTGADAGTVLSDGVRLKSSKGTVIGELTKLIAWDADGFKVPLTVTYKTDSLTVLIDTAGATFPITVDPAVQDTSDIVTVNVQLRSGQSPLSQAAWDNVRNEPDPNNLMVGAASANGLVAANGNDGGWVLVSRGPMAFDLTALSIGILDSAFINIQPQGEFTFVGADTTMFVQGTWSGSAVLTDWNKFTGWAQDSASWANNVVFYADEMVYSGTDSSMHSSKFTASGLTALDSVAGSDTLRVMYLYKSDIYNNYSTVSMDNRRTWDEFRSYLVIYYRTHDVPGVTTSQSEVITHVVLNIDGVIDSDGLGVDSVGAEYFTLGNPADTTSVGRSGVFGVGPFTAQTDSTLRDTSIVVRVWAWNPAGKGYGGWDTVSTAIGNSLMVDGRFVTTID